MAIDPLDPAVDIWTGDRLWSWGCDCGQEEFAEHRWDCRVSPIFAGMDRELLSDITNDLIKANLEMRHTVIRCAECGLERLGKDLLPIYQAPTMRSDDYDGRYKYPGNIVKAVCPVHNRDSRQSYQRAAGTGY